MNADLLTQMIRDIFEKNTMNDNPFSTVADSNINFIETKQFHNKMIVDIEFVGNQHFFCLVLTEEDLIGLPKE